MMIRRGRAAVVAAAATLALLAVLAHAPTAVHASRNTLALTPPMGWMSWEIFRCTTDCSTYPDACINANLYESSALAMAKDGFAAAGYNTVHIDDCWEADERDPATNALVANVTRFPSGLKGVADYVHGIGINFAAYTAENSRTCAGHQASALNEVLDAATFAEWGVDYLKVDGCGSRDYYSTGYTAMGTALQISGRDIVYSCSWPAYLGSNETTKPFQLFIDIGCNLWRNWDDIQCHWSSLVSIIDHWGDYGDLLAQYAGPGHWNDPDMLLVGNPCITDEQARTQMAIWSIIAAPLIMGNDVRNMTATTKAILLNMDAIRVNQDALGRQGTRITPKGTTEVWARFLENGDVAVGLLNKGNDTGVFDEAAFKAKYPDNAPRRFSGPTFVNTGPAATITVTFADIGITGSAVVYDIWAGKSLGSYSTSFSAQVAEGDTAFYRLTPQ